MSLLKRIFGRGDPEEAQKSAESVPLAFEPMSEAFICNPYPFFDHLRAEAPVFRSDFGPWVISRFEDVNVGLSDVRLSNAPAHYAVVNAKNRERYVCADVANNLMAFMDAPAHTEVRKLMARAFHQQMRQGLPDLKSIANAQIGRAPTAQDFDFIECIATPYSMEVILRIFGLPVEDAGKVKRWTDHFFYLFTQIPSVEIREEVDRCLDEFRAYMMAALNRKRESPENDFLSQLVQAQADGADISDVMLADNCMLIFADGIENVDSGIANALHCLLEHGDAWGQMRQGNVDTGAAVDECLRFESPAQFIGRVALEDFEWQGETIRKGHSVLLLLASANRDPARFEQPDTFDVQRSTNPYLSFGRGKHSCLGGALVRLEMIAMMDALLERRPDLELCQAKADWQFRLGHRWLGTLPVRMSSV